MSKKMTEGALVGSFERKLDAMRRVRIPSEWFALMGQPKSVVVMAHPEEKCLVLLSEDAYTAHIGQMRRQAKTNADAQKELAYLLGEAEHLCVNAHNSIRISDKLLRFARIKDQVSLSGDVRYIRIESLKRVRPNKDLNVMKINQRLPPKFAAKWKRLLAWMEGDTETLALAAVDLLWDKYGRDVVQTEKRKIRYAKKIEETKRRLGL